MRLYRKVACENSLSHSFLSHTHCLYRWSDALSNYSLVLQRYICPHLCFHDGGRWLRNIPQPALTPLANMVWGVTFAGHNVHMANNLVRAFHETFTLNEAISSTVERIWKIRALIKLSWCIKNVPELWKYPCALNIPGCKTTFVRLCILWHIDPVLRNARNTCTQQ
jgi:hypothetical protein